MGHAVGIGELEERIARGLGEQACRDAPCGLPCCVVAEAEKDRLGMAGGGQQVSRAVVFLVGAGLFVLADLPRAVLPCLHAADESRLGHPLADLAVDIERGSLVTKQRARGDHRLQAAIGRVVNLRGMAVGVGRQVDLGADDMQKRPGFPGGPLAGFVGGDHIVGIAGHLGSKGRGRSEGSKGVNMNRRRTHRHAGLEKESAAGRTAAAERGRISAGMLQPWPRTCRPRDRPLGAETSQKPRRSPP